LREELGEEAALEPASVAAAAEAISALEISMMINL
jgi:hypothetical protein